jgi:hypothetical protein
MSYQPGNFVQDPAPMNHPNINATPVDYFDYFSTDQEKNSNLIDKLITETIESVIQNIKNWSNFLTRVIFWRTSRSCLCIVVTMKKSQNILKSVPAKHL